jgi:metal transporter CNNM
MAPAPRYRFPKQKVVTDPVDNAAEGDENSIDPASNQKPTAVAMQRHASVDGVAEIEAKNGTADFGSYPKSGFNMRRTSSVAGASERDVFGKRGDTPELREQFKHLGPSNLASRPRQTRYKTVTIKPGSGNLADLVGKKADAHGVSRTQSVAQAVQEEEGEQLVNSAGKDAKDGVQAVQASYGTINAPHTVSGKGINTVEININHFKGYVPSGNDRRNSQDSQSTVGSLHEREQSQLLLPAQRRGVRSGSITENIIDSNGVKKVVLEMTSSSSEADRGPEDESVEGSGDELIGEENNKPNEAGDGKSGKKKRRRKRKKSRALEDTPLLDRN